MKLNLCELKIMERLLSNRINADYDPDVDRLLCKIRKEINDITYRINRTMEWGGKENNLVQQTPESVLQYH